MIIGFFNSATNWGGGEKQFFDIAGDLAHRGHEIHFYVSAGSALHERLSRRDDINVHIIKVGSLSFLQPRKVGRLRRLFREHGLQAVFAILSSDLKVAGRSATAAGIQKVIYLRAVPIPIKNTWLNRYIFRRWATHVVVNSHATARSVLQNNPHLIASDKIKLIYNAVHTTEFVQRPYSALYEGRPEEMVIASVGRLEPEKNHAFLIRLSKALRKAGIQHRILIAGTGSLRECLEEEVRAAGLTDTIHFYGFQSNVKDLLMSCDMFLLPSLFEGFGFAIAEASLCQLPVIAFHTTSIPELILDGQTGFVIDTNSVEQAVDKILHLRDNPDSATAMGVQGRDYIVRNFDASEIMDELEKFLLTP